MRSAFLSALLGLAVVLPTAASAQRIQFKERITIPVRPINATTFEAVENDGAGGTQLWCAAGRFSRDYLGNRSGTVTVLQARGPSAAIAGRNSVIFTTAPVPNSFKSVSQGVRTAGKSFSAGHARALCRSDPERVIRVRVIR